MPNENRQALLELRSVSKFYGDKPVLKKISLTVPPGAALLIVGENGAGKSTLLRLMAGLSRPASGEVRLGLDPDKVGYLGHQTFLYPRLTARENLAFWAGLHGRRLAEADCRAVLDRVGLARAADQRAGTFSRGMAQRLNLARIFLQEPRLLLLDEPASGLDARSAAMLRREIEGAGKSGAATVFVSHDLDQDLLVADQVLYLRRAACAYFGPAGLFDASELRSAQGEGTC